MGRCAARALRLGCDEEGAALDMAHTTVASVGVPESVALE